MKNIKEYLINCLLEENIITDAEHVGESHIEQTLHKLIHPVAAQSHLGADVHAFAELEVGNALAGLADHGALPGDRGQIVDDRIDHLGVVAGLTAADVDDHLVQLRDLHDALIAELFHQGRSDFAFIGFL